MIFGNIRDAIRYSPMDERLIRCFHFAQENDLLTFEKDSHPIDGEDVYVNIAEYETTTPEKRFWEAHRQYIDLHLMLHGTEQVDLQWITQMQQGEYVPKDDFLPLFGEPNCHLILHPGDFVICYPEDGHRTAVAVNEPCVLKKAIFKIRL